MPLALASSLLSFAAPACLNRILAALAPPAPGDAPNPSSRTAALLYAIIMFFSALVKAEVDLFQLWTALRAQARARAIVMADVYAKALRRRTGQGGGASDGKVAQLMSADSMRISSVGDNIGMFLQVPVEAGLAVWGLYGLLGWPCFIGLAAAFATGPLQARLMRRGAALKRTMLGARDYRAERLGEFVGSIRHIKISASEPAWLSRILVAREAELGALLRSRRNETAVKVLAAAVPDLTLLVGLGSVALLSGRQLDVPTLFTSVVLFQMLQRPVAVLPEAGAALLEIRVALERVDAFLNEGEVEPRLSTLVEERVGTMSSRVAIVNGSFTYDAVDAQEAPADAAATNTSRTAKFSLTDITVDFPLGQLSLVYGPTGSGKTSLLMALLGEMICTNGKVHLTKGEHVVVEASGLYDGVAYASQNPFLQHETIQGNITFGSQFEQYRYDAVVQACALLADFAQLEAGDQTEIGEKGISLSGGQKARVALARAVYSRAKTVLLDDPLSAVDSHTAKHLFAKCLKGPLLRDRTVILVTHHVALCLPGAAHVVQLEGGRIRSQGNTNSLDKADVSNQLVNEIKDTPAEGMAGSAVYKRTIDTEAVAAPEVVHTKLVAMARPKGKLVADEVTAKGRVAWSVYCAYFNAVGWDTWVLLVALLLVARGLRVAERVFFSYWGASYRPVGGPAANAAAGDSLAAHAQIGLANAADFFGLAGNTLRGGGYLPFAPGMPSASDSVAPWLLVFVALSLASLLAVAAAVLAGLRGSLRASRSLFAGALTQISRAPFRYWDVTPSGRIASRFAGDFETVDGALGPLIVRCFELVLTFAVNFVTVATVEPVFALPALVLVAASAHMAAAFVRATRDLRRLASTARSSVFSQFSEALQGVVTIRAFGDERRFLATLQLQIDRLHACTYAGSIANRYLCWRFDVLGAAVVLAAAVVTVGAGASVGQAAVAISSAQALTSALYWLCREMTGLETNLNAVERVVELLNTPEEPADVVEGRRPPASWPSKQGGLAVENLVISYAEELPAVIKGVSFVVGPREKIGLVGRTGSGKSTIGLSLLRFAEPTSGRIVLDGVDISTIGVRDLRSRLTLITQEAVLFSGTVRSNLDPFNDHNDAACFDALERVGLIGSKSDQGSRTTSPVQSQTKLASDLNLTSLSSAFSRTSGSGQGTACLSVGLPDSVSAGGLNLSAGQRQLIAMARAVLRRSSVIIMDEATASVDLYTDELISRTIQEEFEGSMVLCIAHRLRTVAGMDKVLVLDNGKVVEYDSPKVLLTREGSTFRAMAKASSEWEDVKRIAGVE